MRAKNMVPQGQNFDAERFSGSITNLVADGDEVRQKNDQHNKEVLTMLKEKLRGGGYQ